MKKGDYVMYSEEAFTAGVRKKSAGNRIGILVNSPKKRKYGLESVGVLWDGMQTAQYYHPSFLKKTNKRFIHWTDKHREAFDKKGALEYLNHWASKDNHPMETRDTEFMKGYETAVKDIIETLYPLKRSSNGSNPNVSDGGGQ